MSPASRWRITSAAALLVVVLSGVYWHYARLPLAYTDLWGHLAYGRWIAEHARLPSADPFMPLSANRPVVDTAWLSQWIGWQVVSVGGTPGLQLLHAAAVALCCGLLVLPLLRNRSPWWAPFAALAVFLALERFQLRIIRPQTAGLACFLAVVALLESPQCRPRVVWAVPLVFCAWANLHGSFPVGIACLALTAAGRMIDQARRWRGWRGALADRRARRIAGLALLSLAATCVNPAGWRLPAEALAIARHPNLRDLIEWAPLDFETVQGRTTLVVGALLIVVGLVGRRQVTLARWLPMIALGVAAGLSARMLVWWAPLAAGGLAGITASGIPSFRAAPRSPSVRSTIWAGVALVSAATALFTSQSVRQLLSHGTRDDRQALAPGTPVVAAEWLAAHPPAGLVYAPYEWGDYLVWAGPRDLQVIVTSHAHLVPPEIWRRHLAVTRGAPDSLEALDEWHVTTLVLDISRQRALESLVETDSRWARVFSEGSVAVFIRRAL